MIETEPTAQDWAQLPNSSECFVCGDENPAGLQTRFFVEDGAVKTVLRPQGHHCGYQHIVHGGVLAAVLDETMGWAAAQRMGLMCFTAELKVRYLRHVPADAETLAVGEVVRAGRRMALAKGRIEGPDGAVYAEAEAKFIPMSPEQTREVDAMLKYSEGDKRVFAHLDEGGGEA